MSFGNSYNGGRTRMATKVYLNVYDLAPINDYLYPIGFGLHHSGVEMSGKEWTFASGAGIFDHTPRDAAGAKWRERLELGTFEGTSAEIDNTINELRSDFGPDKYNLITKNCNAFANALVWALLRKPIPAHVNRLADVGSCCSCLLPKNMLESAPVGDTSNNGYQVSGGVVGASSINSVQSQNINRPAFSGSGHTLGSSSINGVSGFRNILRSSNSGGEKVNDDLTDRREKAKRAALARFERNGNGN
mmetsp:Transcript_16673/g.20380  ORF Transcript_16673/g.20380 Transcript_16673/m.20380 type:complete len:247 (-) Transcript_16673:35-775(-)